MNDTLTSETAAPRKRIRLLDASGIYYPLWHIHESKGDPPGAAADETVQVLRERARAGNADYVVVCCDSGRTFRHAIGEEWKATDPSFRGYKANRPAKDPAMLALLERVVGELEADGYPIFRAPGFEADDIIATLTKWALGQGFVIEIFTRDKDLMALAGPNVTVVWSDGTVMGPDEVKAKFGVEPHQLPEYLAIVGDASDHVPGVKGLGAQSAQAIFAKHGGYEKAVDKARNEDMLVSNGGAGDNYEPIFTATQRKKLIEGAPAFRMSLRMTSLRTAVPLDFAMVTKPRAPTRDPIKEVEREALLEQGHQEAEEEERAAQALKEAIAKEQVQEIMSTPTIPDAEFTDVKPTSDRQAEPQAQAAPATSSTPITAEPVVANQTRPNAQTGPFEKPAVAEPKRDALAIAMPDRPFHLQLEPRNPKEADWLARCIYASKRFTDLVSVEAAYVKIAVGRSMGLTLYQSLSLHMFQGRIVKPAMMIVAQVRQHPQCEYFRKRSGDASGAIWETKRRGDPRVAEWEFTIEDARDAGLVKSDSGWAKYAKNMCSWRAATFLAREEWAEVVGDFLTPEEVTDIRSGSIDTVGEAA